MKSFLFPAVAVLFGIGLLAGCRDRAADAAAQAAAQKAANEQAARENVTGFEDAVSKENWPLAKAQADVLIARYPDTDAAKAVRPRYDEIKAKAEAAREQSRTAALWSYMSEPVKGGNQLSAAIYSKDPVDTGDGQAATVRLIFRDHPDWGKSSYLVLQSGDFDCHGGCKVQVKIDDAPAKAMAALRPKTDEAIAMFVNDERALWKMVQGAKLLSIQFPVKAGGMRTAVFEVAGLDRGKLPKWN